MTFNHTQLFALWSGVVLLIGGYILNAFLLAHWEAEAYTSPVIVRQSVSCLVQSSISPDLLSE